MKFKYILSILFYVSVAHYSLAQITPIETIVDNQRTTYNTQSYSSYNTAFENQSYDLIQDLREDIKLIDNVDL